MKARQENKVKTPHGIQPDLNRNSKLNGHSG